MKTLYGMCENEHLLWRCSSDCASLSIYYWDGEMPAEDKLPDVWKTTSFDKGRMVPVDGIKNAMNVLKVYNVGFWDSQETIKLGPFSFREFLLNLVGGTRVACYFIPNGLNVIWPRDMTPTTRVCHFLSFAVPLIWERAKKEITPLQKCDIAIENLEKLLDIYGPDPVFFKALAALYRARKEIIHEPLADILDQEYIDELYARTSRTSFRDIRESGKKKKIYNVIRKESSDSAFKVTVKKDDLYALADSYNYLQSAEITRHNDLVNHPSHYQLHGGMEVIDIIEAVTWDLPSDEAYAIGNAIKYICRYRNKGKPVQDLEKAKWYLNRAIKDYEDKEDQK